MHRHPVLAWIVVAAAGMPASAPAARPTTSSAQAPASCDLHAWATGQAPAQREVHAGPSADTPVIARLPAPIELGGSRFSTDVTITAAHAGWFRIEDAYPNDPVSDAVPDAVFAGPGWVPGDSLGLSVEGLQLRRAPSADAEIVALLEHTGNDGTAYGPDAFVVERLLDCRGVWVEVEGDFLGKPLRGWTPDTCALPATTCP